MDDLRALRGLLRVRRVTDTPPWRRAIDADGILPEYRAQLDRLGPLVEAEHGPGPYARTVDEVVSSFLGFLNEPGAAIAARDEIQRDNPSADSSPEQRDLRVRLVLQRRFWNAWGRLHLLYAETFAKLQLANRQLELDSGAALFDEVLARIRAHYYLEEEWHYTICALFVMQAWVVRAGSLPAVFYLYFGGAMSSGKSNILYLMAQLTGGLMLENVSPPAIARVMSADGEGRAVLLDEIDVERGQELDDVMAALLRSGYRRNGPPYVRWNAKEKRAETLPIFGPKAGSFRSSLDPALQSRGFVIPTAKPTGEDYYNLVLANLWPRTTDLVPRLKAWGEAAARRWSSDALEEVARTAEFQADLRRVTGALGANRESELVTIALLVARMVPVDAAASLQFATDLRKIEISEDQTEALEELRDAVLRCMGKTVSFAQDGHEVYRVAQKAVRDEINARRKERKDAAISTSRLALLRREWGVKDAWLVEKAHRVLWNLPRAFVDSIRPSPGATSADTLSDTLSDTGGGHPPAGYSPHPSVLPRVTLGNSPEGSTGGVRDSDRATVSPPDVKSGPTGEQGSTGGVPGEGCIPGDAASDKSPETSDERTAMEEYANWTVPRHDRASPPKEEE